MKGSFTSMLSRIKGWEPRSIMGLCCDNTCRLNTGRGQCCDLHRCSFLTITSFACKIYMISVKSYLWKLHTDTSCLDLKKLELSCVSSRVPNKKINQGKCIYIYKFKKYLKLDIGRQKHSPLISGTFPRWRACNVVVASARGGKERCGFLWYAAPSQVCLHRHSCSDLCS